MMSRIRGWYPLAGYFFLFALAPVQDLSAQTLRGLRYEDKTHGFRLRIPRDFVQVPLQEEERWTVAIFQSKREYNRTAPPGYWISPHKPMLKVILFDQEAVKRNSAIELEGGITLTIGRPYRDYKDYVKSNLSAGGYYFSKEEQGTIKKIPVTEYEIKIDKLTTDAVRYVAWVFHGDGYDFAVEIDVLEAQYNKLRNSITSSFRSFEFIPREMTEATEAAAANDDGGEKKDWDEMTVEERMDWRITQEDKREQRLRAKLPSAWTVTKTDNLLVLSHASRNYTRNIISMAEASRKYMEDRFGSLSDEYVRRTVIRICKNYDEYRAYVSGASRDSFLVFAFGNGEITDWSESPPSFRMIMDGVAWHFLSEKQNSYFDMPYWLRTALNGYFAMAVLKGRRVVFERTAAENRAFAELVKNNRDEIKTPLELMQLTSRDVLATYQTTERKVNLRYQFLSLLRFLEGPGQRHKLLKGRDFLLEYLQQVDATTETFKKENPVKIERIKEATTEAEEEQQARESAQRSKQYAQRAEEREKELLAAVSAAMCPWTVDEWKSLTTAYNRYARRR